MKSQLRIFAFVSIGSMMALAGFVAACGDDTDLGDGGVFPPTDSGGRDSTADVVQPVPDTGAPDTGAPDSGVDGSVTVPDFIAQIESELCGSLARCCFGDANLADGGAVDAAVYGAGAKYYPNKCRTITKDIGFEFSNVGASLTDGGTVSVNGARAEDCSAKLRALSCDMTGAEVATIRTACYEAFTGKQATNQPCQASIQCPKGNFCSAVTRTCQPLRGNGGSCDVLPIGPTSNDIADSVTAEEACSTRGGGDTNLRCNSYDPTNPQVNPDGGYLPRNLWTCKQTLPLGSDCNSTVQCSSGICDAQDYVCRSPVTYFLNQCAQVLNP